jgi:hypothetical protein
MNSKILSQGECLLESLLEFYSVPRRISVLYSINKQKATISLRILDWFPTNYAKNNNVHINNKNIYLLYKNNLRSFSKKLYDPFSRRERLFLKFNTSDISKNQKINFEYFFIDKDKHKDYEDRTDGIVTTVGQMNFFKWCIENDIIDYVFKNIDAISRDMVDKIDKRKCTDDTKKTRNKCGTVTRTMMKVVVTF